MSARRRGRCGAIAATAVALLFSAPGATVPGHAQTAWPFHLEWNHDGLALSYFRLCVNNECSVLEAWRTEEGTLWHAQLPVLPAGEHRLVVEACGRDQCLAGTPDMMIRVVAPSSRRPPIDVVSGPRIGVGER